jgi:molybdopterin-guanine dinucleotide biosynthesis protein B
MIPVVSIVGKSGSGKTTFMEKLIPALRRRGWRVATIKHHAHPGFDFDVPGKDTWRHAQAGSSTVLIVSPGKLAMIWDEIGREPTLDEALSLIPDADVVLTEGYHWADTPKIEVFRSGYSDALRSDPEKLMAVVTDAEVGVQNVPIFDLDDAEGVAELIEEKIINPSTETDRLDVLADGTSVRLGDIMEKRLKKVLSEVSKGATETIIRWRRKRPLSGHGGDETGR